MNDLWSLAAALPAERRALARRGWAGEKPAFLNSLRMLLDVSVSIRVSRSCHD